MKETIQIKWYSPTNETLITNVYMEKSDNSSVINMYFDKISGTGNGKKDLVYSDIGVVPEKYRPKNRTYGILRNVLGMPYGLNDNTEKAVNQYLVEYNYGLVFVDSDGKIYLGKDACNDEFNPAVGGELTICAGNISWMI